jgi:hypothetical protein
MKEVSMKRATILALTLLFTAFASITILAQQMPDISGTWVGDTDFPNTPEVDHVTLVLNKAGDSYTGNITVATAKAAPLENLKIEDEDTFSFSFSMLVGKDTVKVTAKLDILDDKELGHKLVGAWTMESGEYGSFDLSPKK